MNSMPFRQLKSFLKILIGVQYDTRNPEKCAEFHVTVSMYKKSHFLLGNGISFHFAQSALPSL